VLFAPIAYTPLFEMPKAEYWSTIEQGASWRCSIVLTHRESVKEQVPSNKYQGDPSQSDL
jgi:hypothetical protein